MSHQSLFLYKGPNIYKALPAQPGKTVIITRGNKICPRDINEMPRGGKAEMHYLCLSVRDASEMRRV